jgi:hypothetical protein
VVRNTYRELEDTTIRTWGDWFAGSGYGSLRRDGMTWPLKFGLPDGTRVDADVLFRALDTPDDVKKVLSLEITGAWVNEAREVPKAIVDGLFSRCGRYPAVRNGGCSWYGLIMDTNPPDDVHWWYRLAEDARPEGWEFFRQPGGVLWRDGQWVDNPGAENLANLPDGYYRHQLAGKNPEWVRVYLAGEYGYISDGRPVFPEYSDATHAAPMVFAPDPRQELIVGIDFGLTPAAAFVQRDRAGRFLVIDELVTEDMGAVSFAEHLGRRLRSTYRGYAVSVYGDPAGEQRSQVDERTPFQILVAAGIPARPAPTNDFTVRREAVAQALSRLVDGKPGLMVSPQVVTIRRGLAGGYVYKRLSVSGEERYKDVPDKNRFSHPLDALQYAMCGAGEGRAVIRGPERRRASRVEDYDPFADARTDRRRFVRG